MLSDKAIQAAKPKSRPYKLADGLGLTLLVKPVGSKLWRFRYRYDGREKMIGFGSYPDTSVKLAREKREKARKLLAGGLDPSGNRQAEKASPRDRSPHPSTNQSGLSLRSCNRAGYTRCDLKPSWGTCSSGKYQPRRDH